MPRRRSPRCCEASARGRAVAGTARWCCARPCGASARRRARRAPWGRRSGPSEHPAARSCRSRFPRSSPRLAPIRSEAAVRTSSRVSPRPARRQPCAASSVSPMRRVAPDDAHSPESGVRPRVAREHPTAPPAPDGWESGRGVSHPPPRAPRAWRACCVDVAACSAYHRPPQSRPSHGEPASP